MIREKKVNIPRNDLDKDVEKINGIDRGFKDTLLIYQNILKGLETQKARNDDVLEKFMDEVEEEMRIPSNRFMDWVKIVKPLMEQIMTSKVMDHDIIERYKDYVDDIIKHNQEFNMLKEEQEETQYKIDKVLDSLFKLEKKFIDAKRNHKEEMNRKQTKLVRTYQLTRKEHFETEEGCCIFCGGLILKDEGECKDCDGIDEEYKQEIRRDNKRKQQEALEIKEKEDLEIRKKAKDANKMLEEIKNKYSPMPSDEDEDLERGNA